MCFTFVALISVSCGLLACCRPALLFWWERAWGVGWRLVQWGSRGTAPRALREVLCLHRRDADIRVSSTGSTVCFPVASAGLSRMGALGPWSRCGLCALLLACCCVLRVAACCCMFVSASACGGAGVGYREGCVPAAVAPAHAGGASHGVAGDFNVSWPVSPAG